MSKRKTDFKVPYRNGKLQQYANGDFGHPEYGYEGEEWRENKPFQATMSISGMYTGRSAKGIYWLGEDGNTYPMFVSDLVDTMKLVDVIDGEITADWVIAKRGQNYGIRIYEAV